MTEEQPTALTPECGPHCGAANNVPGHCNGCHEQVNHGNANFNAEAIQWGEEWEVSK